MKHLSWAVVGQETDLTDHSISIDRKIKQLVILPENVFSKRRNTFSKDDSLLNDQNTTEPVYETLNTSKL